MNKRGPYKSKRLERLKTCPDAIFLELVREKVDFQKQELNEVFNERLNSIINTLTLLDIRNSVISQKIVEEEQK